jgi:hypothetical protein
VNKKLHYTGSMATKSLQFKLPEKKGKIHALIIIALHIFVKNKLHDTGSMATKSLQFKLPEKKGKIHALIIAPSVLQRSALRSMTTARWKCK